MSPSGSGWPRRATRSRRCSRSLSGSVDPSRRRRLRRGSRCLMASTPEGRRLTEQHRLAQQQVRDGFLTEFLALWVLLDTARLDDTGPGWVRAVLRLIQDHRLRSAEVAADYYHEFQSAEAPNTAPRPRVDRPRLELPAGVDRPPPRPRDGRPPRRPGPDVIPEPRQSRVRFDLDESAFRPREPRRTRIEIPDIDWSPSDRAARVSLTVTGPGGLKSDRKSTR